MTHSFPEKTIDHIFHEVARLKKEYPNYSEKRFLDLYWDVVKKQPYYFRHNLYTGLYVHYLHEMMEKRIGGFNCTNIIPHAYLWFEGLFGTKPQIVQFKEFRDITKKKKKDLDENPFEDSHFGLIATLPEENKRYLIDPFYDVCGKIRDQGSNYLKLRTLKREFSEILYYSEQEFADMMTRLADSGESLDMLIPGQRVGVTEFHKVSCAVMVYYKDLENILTTRLSIPQPSLQKKIVYFHMQMDDEGEIQKKTLDLYLCKDTKWIQLIRPKKIASITYEELSFFRKKLGKILKLDSHPRIGTSLLKSENETVKLELLEITKAVYDRLTIQEKELIEKTIRARSMYEYARGTENYLFDAKKHDEKINEIIKECNESGQEKENIRQTLFAVGWKLEKIPINELCRLRRRNQVLKKREEQMIEEMNELNHLRFDRKKLYSRLRDLRVFADTIERMNAEEGNTFFEKYSCNSMVGYLATIADFIPYIISTENEISLSLFQSSLKEKICARKARKRIVVQDSETKMDS